MKKKNIISLILNLAIIGCTIYAIGCYFFMEAGSGNMHVHGAVCLRFFTNLSNILVAITSVIMLVFNFKNLKTGSNSFPKWAMLLKFMGTVSVTLTFITVVFFLGPTFIPRGFSYWFMFQGNCFFLHFFTPILAALSILFFERCDGFSKKNALVGLVPTVVYSIVYFIMVIIVGQANGGWDDFYGFTFGGKYFMIPISVIAMYAATWFISWLEWKIQKKINKQ